jgi:hypothetical protein
MRTIVAKEQIDCEHLLGQFLDESHYDELINEDCNFFAPPSCGIEERTECGDQSCSSCPKGIDEDKVIFIFRKNFFTEEEQLNALEGLKGAAGQSQNRGLAAGPRGDKLQGRDWVTEYQLDILDYFTNPPSPGLYDEDIIEEIKNKHKNAKEQVSTRGCVWLTSKAKAENFNFDEWVEEVKDLSEKEKKSEAERVRKLISDTNYAAPVFSGVAGWFDRYPRIPYGRATAYTERNMEKFQKSYPFLQKLSNAFSQLLPRRWGVQKSCVDKIDPAFHVTDTVFTTITVNKSFRTAAHRDAGDLQEGFSNLSVLTNGKKYSGGYLILPEFRVAVNIRPGDLLLINNHGGIHGNTPIVLDEKGAERYSVVCYFREKMLELGSKEYEEARFEFIESRRLNKNHTEWRPLWNGISPSMWDSKEWLDFLLKRENGKDLAIKYHKSLYDNTFNKISFEDFICE